MTDTLWLDAEPGVLLYFFIRSDAFLPDDNYKKYIQFYMGLLLILLLLSPVLDFLQLENKIDAGVDRYMEEEERTGRNGRTMQGRLRRSTAGIKKVRIRGYTAAGSGRFPAGRSGGTMKPFPEMLKKEQIVVVLLAGILLLIIAMPVKKKDTEERD